MAIKENSSAAFIDRLEALRGVVALWVAVGHSTIWLVIGSEPAIWSKALWEVHGFQARTARAIITIFSGAAAVDIFFVLSGFVLARSIFGKPIATASYLLFVGKRLFRIVPAFWFSLAVVVLYLTTLYPGHAVMVGGSDWFHRWYTDPLSIREIIKNATFIALWLNPNAWTLKVEILASLLLPILVLAMGERSWARTVCVLLGTLLLAWFYRDAPSDSPHYFYMFVVGASVAKHGPREPGRTEPSKIFLIVCLSAITIASACLPLIHPLAADILVTAGIAGLIWAISFKKNTSFFFLLDSKWARFLGRISYSFYLLHFIVLYAVGNVLLHVLPTYVVLRFPLGVMLASCCLSIALALPIALFAFIFVEKPFTLAGRRILIPQLTSGR